MTGWRKTSQRSWKGSKKICATFKLDILIYILIMIFFKEVV